MGKFVAVSKSAPNASQQGCSIHRTGRVTKESKGKDKYEAKYAAVILWDAPRSTVAKTERCQQV